MVNFQSESLRDEIEEVTPTVEQPTIAAVMSPGQALEQREHASKDIYFVSGLGADERVFRLLKFEGYRPVHIRWLEPERGEALADYASRLTAQIQSDCPVIVGLSFGGLIAVEMAKQIEVEKVILISSAKQVEEIPFYYRLFRWLPIHRVFPFKTLLWAVYWLAYWIFGTETAEERQLLKTILLDTDPHFLKWALHRVVIWNNEAIPKNLCHIHGLRDRIFPIWFARPDYVLERGGHLMILNRAARISTLLEEIIG